MLGSRDVGEADRSIVLYTKDFGKIIAFAKGLRLEKAKLRAHLGLLGHSRVMIASAREGYRLLDAEIIREFYEKNYARFHNAVLFASFVASLVAGEEKDTRLWELLKETFSQGVVDDVALIASKKHLLDILGMMPESGIEKEEDILSILAANHMVQ